MKYIINWKKDIIVEKFAASSKGGQNANKVENNVRLTHIPSGLKAQSTQERSLEQNMNEAIDVLIRRIAEWLKSQQETFTRSRESMAFGNKRRTYHLSENNSVQKVIDHKNHITSYNKKILCGDIDIFIKGSIYEKS